MAVFGSLFFKRTLKQFLDCDDLESTRGVAVIEKLRHSAGESLELLIEAIPSANGLHRAMLTEICLEHVGVTTEDLLLKGLDNDTTEIRATTVSILSQSSQINPTRLLKRLHAPDAPRAEIIGILDFQAAQLKPEQIISNALRLDRADAEQLLKLAYKSEQPLDLDVLHIEPASIESPSIKIMLLRFLGEVEQSGVAPLIVRFLSDSNKTVIIEALKALKGLKVDFDASLLLPAYASMTEVARQLAFEILEARADAELVSKLAPLTCGKSDEMRDMFINLLARHVTTESLETFLKLLDQQEWWGKEQAVKGLHKLGNDRLFAAAQGLNRHENEFIREQAQRLAAQASDPGDVKQLWANALHENWQVRDNAIEAIGKSGNRESMSILKKVIDKWPESATAVLQAVSQLGQTKGLEIAFACLRMPEALVQREALESIGKLTSERHAKAVRDKLMQLVPSLQATVRDTAGEVVARLTEQFKLQALNVDQETYFDTRLIKFDDTGAFAKGTTQTQAAVPATSAATETLGYQNIEEFKKGDLWLDRYRIDREIGRGAMGRVMLATDQMVGENLILKFMHPELTAEEASRERFLREVRYSRKVSHPNVIRVHDMLSHEGLSAISMEFFESRGVDEILKEKKYFEADEGLKILLQMANGMGAAHDQEVIHRDLKPSNVLMNSKGLVKIVDFGIASATSKSDATLTQVGSIIGTPAYLSPERARGLEADHRSDIYALGVIAYCMFTGKLPYVGEPMSLLYQHIEGKAKPLHEVRDTINPRISLFVQKLMVVDVEDRLQTMDDVAEAIREVQKKLA
ncbi:protein kinase [Gammaproteobacteria bacterium]|nr:protein kinase [Gammaproteobacteria bacterium]